MTTAVKAPATFRQSLLARFDRCPKSAEFYLQFDGGTESHAKQRGSAFHAFAERAINQMVEMNEPTMPGDVARELADAVMAENLDWVLSTEDQDVVRQCAWNFGEGVAIDPEAVIGVEVPLELHIGGVVVTCTLDLIEVHGSTLYITDWKTSLAIKRHEEIARGFQGQTYALASLAGFRPDTGLSLGAGINDVWFREAYPRYRDEETGGLVVKEAGWTRAELGEFRDSLKRQIEAFERSIETGDFPARDGSWCSTCPAPKLCPIPAELREIEDIETPEQAQEAFSRKLSNEREGRRIQSALRGYVQREEAPIYQGDLAFGVKVSESKSVKDWPAFLHAIYQATELGVPLQLEDHVKERTSTKYAKRKQTPEELEKR